MSKKKLFNIDKNDLMFNNKVLFALLIPIVIEQLLNSFMGMVDTMMVSNLGSQAISGVSLVDSVNNLIVQLFSAMATGAAIIHYSIVEGNDVEITVAPKGFGSENMSRIFMLKPADGIDGVKNAILTAVKEAGPNACPPMVVGVGIGGTFEKCALLAKEALTRNINERSKIPYVKELEEEMLEKINCLGIGPGGLGGSITAFAVNIETYPTHIAGLPVAVNICCHVNRHSHRVI